MFKDHKSVCTLGLVWPAHAIVVSKPMCVHCTRAPRRYAKRVATCPPAPLHLLWSAARLLYVREAAIHDDRVTPVDRHKLAS